MGRCGWRPIGAFVGAMLSVCLAAPAGAGESPSPASAKGWEQLHLSETTIAGTTVDYETVLEPDLPVFARMKLRFYLVRGATAKAFLRAGGQLPNCTYDRQADAAVYNPQIRVAPGGKVPENWDFAVPVPSDRPFDEFVAGTFAMLQRLCGSCAVGVAIHEVTEMTMIRRMRPTDPYCRWFSVFSLNYLQSFHNAALFLCKLGYEPAGDQVMHNAIQLYSQSPAPAGREVALESFLIYALACEHPRKAESIAEELLRTRPEHGPSLTVKMCRCLDHRDLAGAKELARRIRGLTKPESRYYRLATVVLDFDPNQPRR